MSSDILPPISEVTATDHGAFVLITNGFGLCLVLIFTIIRVFARMFINPPFDRDDLLMGVATVRIREKSTKIYTLTDSTALGHNILGALVLRRFKGVWQSAGSIVPRGSRDGAESTSTHADSTSLPWYRKVRGMIVEASAAVQFTY